MTTQNLEVYCDWSENSIYLCIYNYRYKLQILNFKTVRALHKQWGWCNWHHEPPRWYLRLSKNCPDFAHHSQSTPQISTVWHIHHDQANHTSPVIKHEGSLHLYKWSKLVCNICLRRNHMNTSEDVLALIDHCRLVQTWVFTVRYCFFWEAVGCPCKAASGLKRWMKMWCILSSQKPTSPLKMTWQTFSAMGGYCALIASFIIQIRNDSELVLIG